MRYKCDLLVGPEQQLRWTLDKEEDAAHDESEEGKGVLGKEGSEVSD